MTIQLNRISPDDKLIELGGGAAPLIRPNVDVRPCHDGDGNPTVDFTANFEEPLPIQSEEWDGVFSKFVIEHISWRKLPFFLSEVFRILKPGGKAVLITANTDAQIEWIKNNPNGWDGKGSFEAFSCVLFGDQDYPDNTHKSYFSPAVAFNLLLAAGFANIVIRPYGERATDILIEAVRPKSDNTVDAETSHEVNSKEEGGEPCNSISSIPLVATGGLKLTNESPGGEGKEAANIPLPPPEQLFDKSYFNGGGKWGGYAREGLWDYPVHEITARHILARQPNSVLEIGCARGYILKRIQDSNIPAAGIEVSRHCCMTRVSNGVMEWDLLQTPWPVADDAFDLCYSVAVLEHIPEEKLPSVIREMARACRRGLHGIDFGEKDDGFDKTHCTLRPVQWWRAQFVKAGVDLRQWELVDKEDLERGTFPDEVLKGDGKVKLNVGSFTTMFHHGWLNIDVHDLGGFAQQNGYQFLRHDVRQGLPFNTGTVDYVFACHFLEHLSYGEGRSFLKECRRVLKPDTGCMRILVPDADLLIGMLHRGAGAFLHEFDEINEGCANAPTPLAKLWALLHEGHQAAYDWPTLSHLLEECGLRATLSGFRKLPSKDNAINSPSDLAGFGQIHRETLDVLPCLTLYVNAIPVTG